MTASDQVTFSENHNDVKELTPFGATMEDTLPSFSSILGAGNDEEARGLPPAALAKKISAINEFYEGIKAPYLSARNLMRKSVSEKRGLIEELSDKKDKKAVQLEIEELEDGLNWSEKKLSILEAERKALVFKLQ
ncbi:MAG: hypothetical protein H0X41_04725 [Chitinophagaceae bacterium]|nr:hypothetical protein [Chitinophagaceae bacterium]